MSVLGRSRMRKPGKSSGAVIGCKIKGSLLDKQKEKSSDKVTGGVLAKYQTEDTGDI